MVAGSDLRHLCDQRLREAKDVLHQWMSVVELIRNPRYLDAVSVTWTKNNDALSRYAAAHEDRNVAHSFWTDHGDFDRTTFL